MALQWERKIQYKPQIFSDIFILCPFHSKETDDNTFFNRNLETFSAFISSGRHWYLLLVNLGSSEDLSISKAY